MRVSDDARKCVVFFGVPSPTGIKYGGTGFLVAYEQGDLSFGYLVTCRHVAKALESYEDTGFYLRVNLTNGTSFEAPLQKIGWTYHPDANVDLAGCVFVIGGGLDHKYFPLKLATDETDIRCGDVVNVVGLFRLHVGKKRNIPIVHTGNVAALPDGDETLPMKDRTTGKVVQTAAYLIEAQTLDGLSGSPVFSHAALTKDFSVPFDPDNALMGFHPTIKLLGLYAGSWDGEPGKILEEDRSLSGSVRVPVGMGIVIPTSRIRELLEVDAMKKIRAAAVANRECNEAATTDSAFGAPRASETNPTHREDFTSLLSAAARTRPQDD